MIVRAGFKPGTFSSTVNPKRDSNLLCYVKSSLLKLKLKKTSFSGAPQPRYFLVPSDLITLSIELCLESDLACPIDSPSPFNLKRANKSKLHWLAQDQPLASVFNNINFTYNIQSIMLYFLKRCNHF